MNVREPMPRSLTRLTRLVRLVAATVAAASLFPGAASAHSFLIRSDPETGARLAKAPATMKLYFSEAFVRGSEQVTIRNASEKTVKLPPSKSGGTVIRQPLPSNLRGVFVVSWRVLSDDGHISLGEFAFGAGSTAALPTVRNSTQRTSWSQVAASWLVFVGLALALGGLVSERFVWRRTAMQQTVDAAPLVFGVALAVVGGLLEFVLLAGNQRGRGFGSGFSGSAIADALGTRPGKLMLALLAALVLSSVLVSVRRLRIVAIAPLLVAVVFIAEGGHSGTSGKLWAVAADSIHLALVAVWLGALVHLFLTVARAPEARPALAAGVNRYSRFALPTVLAILATGVLTAIPEFRSVGAVFSSGYGQTLLVKSGLIGIALLLALFSRLRALPANPHLRLPLLRRLTVAEATTLAAVLGVAAVMVNAAPARGPVAAEASSVLGPPPVAGPALRLADLAGQLVVGMTAGERELELTILPPDHSTARGATLKAEARRPDGRSVDLYPRSCGAGCYVIRYRLQPGMTIVTADVKTAGWSGGKAQFSLTWPFSPPADALLRRVTRVTRALPVLTLREAVTSGPGSRSRPTSYTLSGKAFLGTELFASGAVDVRALARVHGLTEIAFAFPGSDVWYRIWVDDRDRIRRETIVSVGHLIRRSFRYSAAAATSASSLATPSPFGKVPNPPPGAVVMGQEDGDLAVGLAIRPLATELELSTTVLGSSGAGVDGLNVTYAISGRKTPVRASARSCGTGCYVTIVGGVRSPTRVRVDITGGINAPSSVTFNLPRPWPPPVADTLVQKVGDVYRSLKTLVVHERLASSPTAFAVTTWELQTPDRLAYQIKGGPSAIIIGQRRWDTQTNGAWKESPQEPIRQPTPFWTSESNAHRIGSTEVAGRQAWVISFYDKNLPGFFTIAVDKKTFRTLDLRMTAAAHFMHHRYSGFNTPISIKPPG